MRLAGIALMSAATIAAAQSSAVLRLTNPLDGDRGQEVVEVPLAEVFAHAHVSRAALDHLVARDAKTGQRVESQVYASKAGADADTLLLLVHLSAQQIEDVRLKLEDAPEPQPALVFGREAPERKDDFAWENQQVAYRVYGPALQATGEITSGIDVWSKRVPNFVIDSFYKRDAEGARTHNPSLSYHKDNGQGLDSYYVGPTRGCGGTAVLVDGKLVVSKNYTTNRILADGPIRFAFELTYAPWEAGGTSVTESKLVVLDAGTHLNRITSMYAFAGAQRLELAAGIAMHKRPEVSFPVKDQVASVWDVPQDPSAGMMATGLVADSREHAHTEQIADHALLVFARRSGEPFTYYAGSGWSKADMPTNADWNAYLKLELEKIEHPVRVAWGK